MSIRDVAKASGVSLTTVSLILNHSDHRISQATRDRVLETIARLGYRPNRLAQGLQSRRSRILAILVPQLSHTFADVYFGELISGVYDHASSAGYKILLEVASTEFIRDRKYVELFDGCFVDGLLFMGAHDRHTFIADLARRNYPFILVNNQMPGLNCVVCDYAAAGRLAAEHLLRRGHCRIGMIHGPADVQTARTLKESFWAALAGQGVDMPEAHFEDGLYTEESGAAAAERLLERIPSLTALFAGSDKMAIGAMHRLLTLGRQVPGDVAVIGCNDIRQASFVMPALTTVRLPLYETGRRCCRHLIDLLGSPQSSIQEVMPVELIPREST